MEPQAYEVCRHFLIKVKINPNSTKSLKGYDGYKTFSIRIQNTTVEEIEKIVSETGYSRNELIGISLDYAVKNCVIDK